MKAILGQRAGSTTTHGVPPIVCNSAACTRWVLNERRRPYLHSGVAHCARGPCRLQTRTAAAATAANQQVTTTDVVSWESYEDEIGPAFKDTLGMLEWQRLCDHLSKHASTALGKRLGLQLSVPLDQLSSERLLQETRAMLAMENDYMSLLDYGGISTFDAESAIKRASKGGMVAAKQLRGLVALLQGADRLKRQIQLVARQNHANHKGSLLWPLLAAVAQITVPAALMRDITSIITEDGELTDAASEQVRTTRGRVRALQGRINSILKGYPGEASEKSGRLCIAAPAGTKINNGVMLGSSVGGGMVFIEPAQIVSLNNELAAARAEAMAAEESVLWELSGRLMGVIVDVETAFNLVGWLDLLSAKVRFGTWLGAIMPQFTPWENVFQSRSGAALEKVQKQQQQQPLWQQQQQLNNDCKESLEPTQHTPHHQHGQHQQQQGGQQAVNWESVSAAAAAGRAAVHLRKFSHPLLLADYLEQRQQLERQMRQQSGYLAGSSSSSSGPKGGRKQISNRMLGTRKDVMLKQGQLHQQHPDSSSDNSEEQELTVEQQLAVLKAPQPIDLVIPPETSVIVITGPNTGGKTAAMKGFGLAVLMAKAGLLLPAQAPVRLPCYSSVLADIGDEQSLTANLSTFSGHMKRISALRAEADGRSLLLLDELGTGTDPTEGAALGLALLKQLIKGGLGNGALIIATTHHSMMTGLKFEDPRAENASVEFNEEQLAPTYKLLWGVPGRSNALNIASRLGLDKSIIAAARQRLSAGAAATDTAIEQLEAVQEELRQADLALYAITTDLDATKKRMADIRELVLAAQQQLAVKRAAAVEEVYSAASKLLRALKQERKALLKGNTQGKISRQLDLAMGDDVASSDGSRSAPDQSAQTLDDAIESFWALSNSSNSITSNAAAPRQLASAFDALRKERMQQQLQQWQQQEEWVQIWAALLAKARKTLAGSILSSNGGSNSSGSDSGLPDSDTAEDLLESELTELHTRAAAKEARRVAELAAVQQQLLSAAAGGDSAAASLSPAAAAGASAGDASAKQVQSKIDQEVQQELFAAGVAIVEEALEHDPAMQQLLESQQIATEAQLAEQQQQQAQHSTEQLVLMAAFEQELDQWDADLSSSERQQQQKQPQQQSQQQQLDLDMIWAFESMLDDVVDDSFYTDGGSLSSSNILPASSTAGSSRPEATGSSSGSSTDASPVSDMESWLSEVMNELEGNDTEQHFPPSNNAAVAPSPVLPSKRKVKQQSRRQQSAR